MTVSPTSLGTVLRHPGDPASSGGDVSETGGICERSASYTSFPPSAVLHHGAGRNRCSPQHYVVVCRRMHHSDGCDFLYHPLASGTNGAQVEEDSARPDRLALPARASYARTLVLVCSNHSCLH